MGECEIETNDIGSRYKLVQGDKFGTMGFRLRELVPIVILDFHIEGASTLGNFLGAIRDPEGL